MKTPNLSKPNLNKKHIPEQKKNQMRHKSGAGAGEEFVGQREEVLSDLVKCQPYNGLEICLEAQRGVGQISTADLAGEISFQIW